MSNVTRRFPVKAIDHARQLHTEYAGYLARQLTTQLQIPHGSELIPYLGFGFESSNLEAIESWVFMVCTELKLPFSSEQVPVLESHLVPILEALKNDSSINQGGSWND